MNIAVIIPDRGDRPQFMSNCLRILSTQTLQAVHVEVVNYPPQTNKKDLSQRYRIGYEKINHIKNIDLVAFWENDDWYHHEYLERMSELWMLNREPNIIGLKTRIYYHLRTLKYGRMDKGYPAMFNTCIKPYQKFDWCADDEMSCDYHLWRTLSGIEVYTPKILSIGMKHGIGMSGGRGHDPNFSAYKNDDRDLRWLKSILDEESFYFYTNIFK